MTDPKIFCQISPKNISPAKAFVEASSTAKQAQTLHIKITKLNYLVKPTDFSQINMQKIT
jgi:hypothetical protein